MNSLHPDESSPAGPGEATTTAKDYFQKPCRVESPAPHAGILGRMSGLGHHGKTAADEGDNESEEYIMKVEDGIRLTTEVKVEYGGEKNGRGWDQRTGTGRDSRGSGEV